MHSMQGIVSRIIRAMGTDLSREAVKLHDSGDYRSLVGLTVSPGNYTCAKEFLLDAQVVSTFRKLEGLPTGIDLQQKAVDSFFSSEKKCKSTNDRLSQYENWFSRGFVGDSVDEKLYCHIADIRNAIANVLGPIPKDLVPRFSGGSTYYDRGDEITVPHKLDALPSVTENAWAVIRDLFRGTAWERAVDFEPRLVNGNRFTAVPKDSTKHRGICIEPSLNIAYQLPVGQHIRNMLLGIGIDIKGQRTGIDAQTVHRKAALQASLDGLIATIDLSNASDTIAYMLVKLLLPKGWFDLLVSLRSPMTYINGKWHKNHKFSSMGNGFTFELETLIFWAITKSVSPGFVSVYGDDILIPAEDSGNAMKLLELFGFEINHSKSFTDPFKPFRESCGGDYFGGEDVRPIYLKKIPDDPGSWIVLANLITKIIGKVPFCAHPELLYEAWNIAINQVARKYRMFGPTWAGDMVIHSEDRTSWRTRPHEDEDGQTGYAELKTLHILSRKVSLKRFPPRVQLASALLGVPSSGPVPRDGILGYKTIWRPTVM